MTAQELNQITSISTVNAEHYWEVLFGNQWNRSFSSLGNLQAYVNPTLKTDDWLQTGPTTLSELCRFFGNIFGLSFFGLVELSLNRVVFHEAAFSNNAYALDALRRRLADSSFHSFCESYSFNCEKTLISNDADCNRESVIEQIVIRYCGDANSTVVPSKWIQVAYVQMPLSVGPSSTRLKLTTPTYMILSALADIERQALSSPFNTLSLTYMTRLLEAISYSQRAVHEVNNVVIESLESRRLRLNRSIMQQESSIAQNNLTLVFVKSCMRKLAGFLFALVLFTCLRIFLPRPLLVYAHPVLVCGSILAAGFAVEVLLGSLFALGVLQKRKHDITVIRSEHNIIEKICTGADLDEKRRAFAYLKKWLRSKQRNGKDRNNDVVAFC